VHIALQGALIGLAVALVVFVIDYLLSRSLVKENAKQRVARPELVGNEKRRVAALARFCILLPPIFALAFWIIWG
jgi:hypothetical protein